MSIRVEKYTDPSVKRSNVETVVHHAATSFRITPAGTLEIIEIKGGEEVVCNAYGVGHWIEAYEAREAYEPYMRGSL